VPAHLRSAEFFRAARRRLGRSGLVLANVLLDDDRDGTADAIARAMAEAGLAPRVLDTPGEVDRNAIVMGGFGQALVPPRLLVAPRRDRQAIAAELAAMRFRPWRRRGPWPMRQV